MDVLADVLETMRLQSHVNFCMKLTAPWGIGMPVMESSAVFYAVTRGSCYLEVDGFESPIALVGGDLVMLPHGKKHVLRDQLESPVVQIEEFEKQCPNNDSHKIFQHGGNGSLTSIISGCFVFENRISKLFLSVLPPLIYIPGDKGQLVPWLDTTLKWMYSETTSENPGAQVMISHLTDILFIQILRAHIAEHTQQEKYNGKSGWLRAITDPSIGKAFELIHEQPDSQWTVAELASQVNMSRTAFSVRFSQLAGVPPLTYVTKWRMFKASDLLRQGTTTISEIAAKVGYDSDASFSKAFKREMGIAPGTYRKEGAEKYVWQ